MLSSVLRLLTAPPNLTLCYLFQCKIAGGHSNSPSPCTAQRYHKLDRATLMQAHIHSCMQGLEESLNGLNAANAAQLRTGSPLSLVSVACHCIIWHETRHAVVHTHSITHSPCCNVILMRTNVYVTSDWFVYIILHIPKPVFQICHLAHSFCH